MTIPHVTDRIKEAPAVVLRALFAGIGQLLLAADKLRARAQEPIEQPATPPPDGAQPDRAHSADTAAVRTTDQQAPPTAPPTAEPAASTAAEHTTQAGEPTARAATSPKQTAAAQAEKPATATKKSAAAPAGEPAARTATSTKKTTAARAGKSTTQAGKPTAPAAAPTRAQSATAAKRPAGGRAEKPATARTRNARTGKPSTPAKPATAPPAAAGTKKAASTPPIPQYDDLSLASLRARLRVLDTATVRDLLAYEKSHAARDDVITMFERRLSKLGNGAG